MDGAIDESIMSSSPSTNATKAPAQGTSLFSADVAAKFLLLFHLTKFDYYMVRFIIHRIGVADRGASKIRRSAKGVQNISGKRGE